MGLDMYAYAVEKAGVKSNALAKAGENAEVEVDFDIDENAEREELMYWRKHPNLHGWMALLYRAKGGKDPDFNMNSVRLTEADLDALEKAVNEGTLPHTEGFFFGQSYGDEVEQDLLFVRRARAALKAGHVVYYTSWW